MDRIFKYKPFGEETPYLGDIMRVAFLVLTVLTYNADAGDAQWVSCTAQHGSETPHVLNRICENDSDTAFYLCKVEVKYEYPECATDPDNCVVTSTPTHESCVK